MTFHDKVVRMSELPAWRESVRKAGKTLAVTNGCFDLLHVGHATYLEGARKAGDLLLVGVNGDQGVRELKGDSRPINVEEDRAALLAALESVCAVCVFPQKRAVEFLKLAQPDVYIKGGDYTIDTLDKEERAVVESCQGKFVFIPFVPGKSTSNLVQKITKL